MRISRINAAEVLDSRGNPTVEAGVSTRPSGSVMPEPSLVATRRIEGAGEWSR
jgi:enolase